MTTEKLIHFSAMSSMGDTPYDLLPGPALAKIKSIADKEDKWVFIDGVLRDPNQITTGDLIKSENIIVSASLVGGTEKFNVRFDITKKFDYTGDTIIAVSLEENPDVIDILVNHTRMREIFLWRKTLYSMLETGLKDLTVQEYNAVMVEIGEDTMKSCSAITGGSVDAKFVGAIKPSTDLLIGFDPALRVLTIRVLDKNRYDTLNARGHILGAIKNQLEGTVQQNAAGLKTALRI